GADGARDRRRLGVPLARERRRLLAGEGVLRPHRRADVQDLEPDGVRRLGRWPRRSAAAGSDHLSWRAVEYTGAGVRAPAPVDSTLVSDSPETPQITPEAVESAVDAALAAIAAASDTAELKAARAAHVAEGSPLAVLNASMRQVAPEHKAAFGKLIGQGRGRVTQALAAKESELAEAEVAARLEAERVDIT